MITVLLFFSVNVDAVHMRLTDNMLD